MKSILLSLLVLGLVGGLAGGSMFAYFSDTETSTGNTFTAGTIDLSLSGDIGEAVHGSVQDDFKPCETGTLEYTITNDGLNPADVWKHIFDVQCVGNLHPESELEEDPDDTINDISGVTLFSMEVAITGDVGTIGDSTVNPAFPMEESEKFTVTAASHHLVGLGYVGVESNYIYLGVLGPGDSMTVTQYFHLDGDTTDWAQGDHMTFNEEFYGLQTVGSVAPPANQLPGYAK